MSDVIFCDPASDVHQASLAMYITFPAFNMICSFHMLKCPGSKIFRATTGGKKHGHRSPMVAVKLMSFKFED